MGKRSVNILILILLLPVAVMQLALCPQVTEASPYSHTYDFSNGAGVDKWAWEKGSKHLHPADTGSGAADISDYTTIAPENGWNWKELFNLLQEAYDKMSGGKGAMVYRCLYDGHS